MKILVIEDDRKIASYICKGLRQAGYVPEHAVDGQAGLFRGATEEYDCVIADIMLPKLDGLSVIDQLRRKGVSTPIIILSAKASVDDRVKGLQKGGDDYLVKPFAFSELLARIQALIRRATAQAEPTSLRVADLEIDLLRQKVFRNGNEISLQPLEYSLLAYLAHNSGRVVSKTMIIEHVWEYNFDPRTNIVETRICRLRDKIDRPFDTQLIHTVRGFGYVLEAKV